MVSEEMDVRGAEFGQIIEGFCQQSPQDADEANALIDEVKGEIAIESR